MQPSHAPDQGVGPDGHAALWRLAATPEGLREVLNGIGDIFFSHDEQGKLVFISGAFEAVTGWSAQEALGSDALRLVHPDDHAIAAESLRATMEGKAPGRFELRTLCKSGDYRTLEYRLSPLRSGGRVVGTIGVARDMTEQKQAEAALRQSEDHFRRITEWVTDYIFTVHVENGAPVRTVHGAACEAVTGYTAAEFASDPYLWIRMVPEEDCPTVLRQAASILAGGKVEAIEHRIVRKDGVVRWVRNTPALHYDAQGRLVSYDGLVRDVTELKRIEEQLRQTAKMEALGQLAGGIAHDFNNLLTAILGFANILKNSVPAGGEAHEAACTIERAAERASDMTSRLLGFARKGKTQIAPVDLEATVEETARLLSRTLDKNIHITCRFGPERLWTLGDPTQMQQVFLNLAVNARDAMPKGGDLLIRAERMEIAAEAPQRRAGAAPGSYAVVSMSDSGCGIPPENLERIFEPFFTTKSREKGTGMGLATVYSIVRNHGGWVEVDSVVGKGSTFRVALPLLPEGAAEVAKAHVAAKPPATGHGTVLVVDDEEVVRAVAVSMLDNLGYRSYTASGGVEAQAVYRERMDEVDLVLMDLIMPDMGGRECLEAIRQVDPAARAIISSGYGPDSRSEDMARLGVVGYIQKPYTVQEMAEALSAALGNAPRKGEVPAGTPAR